MRYEERGFGSMRPPTGGRRWWVNGRWLGVSSILLLALLPACSLRSLAVSSLADALAGASGVYASDEDPELVREALPFALKTYETLLAEAPEDIGLLLAACRGFTQYAAGFVETDAELAEVDDWERAEVLRERALKLYLRARDYCLRGLEEEASGIDERLRLAPREAAGRLDSDQLELIFWTAASWGSAISIGLDRPELMVDLPAVEALVERALELDPDWDDGAIHEVMIRLEALPEAMGGSPRAVRRHFERAVELSDGERASPYVTFATRVSVSAGRRSEFVELLETALGIDPDARPASRLANLLAQRRARFLLEHVDDYFLPPEGSS